MALIIIGIVAGVSLLIIFLAIVLVAVVSHKHNEDYKMQVRITLAPVGDVTEEAIAKSEQIIGQRLKGLGIEDFNIYSDPGRIVVEIPAVKDPENVRIFIGSSGQLQFRQVLEILEAGDPAYDTTPVTEIDPTDEEAYRALKDQEVVLEKEVDGNTYKVKLGPTRLTGDIINSATADVEEGTKNWKIDFTLTDDAAMEFADLTGELSEEREPGNQLAIVLDYQVLSYPRVNEAITGGKGQITGIFIKEEAQDLALILMLGALPVDFTKPVIEVIGE